VTDAAIPLSSPVSLHPVSVFHSRCGYHLRLPPLTVVHSLLVSYHNTVASPTRAGSQTRDVAAILLSSPVSLQACLPPPLTVVHSCYRWFPTACVHLKNQRPEDESTGVFSTSGLLVQLLSALTGCCTGLSPAEGLQQI